jgi:hypothetical protein
MQYFCEETMNRKVKKTFTTLVCSLVSYGLLIFFVAACGESDPQKEALNKAVQLMSRIVTSKVLIDAVHNSDPNMQASTAAGAALSGGITANFPQPPEGIAILNTIQPTQTWSVTIKADDTNKQVIIEGYGEDLNTPLITKTIDFPPK